ncbi:unnamed protein product, partial [marine sediment metagenome]
MVYYYGFFTIILTVLFFILKILYSIVKEKKLGLSFADFFKFFLAVFVFILIVFPHFLSFLTIIKKEPTDFAKELIQLETYSARIWEYFIPSVGNPFFKNIVSNFVFSHLHGSNLVESTLYLGFVPIIFGLIGIYFIYFGKNKIVYEKNKNVIEEHIKNNKYLKNNEDKRKNINVIEKYTENIRNLKHNNNNDNNTNNNKGFLLFYLTILLIFSIIISLDPIVNIFGLEIKFPSYYLFKLLPVFRVYTRFYPFILMSLIVIASIGMNKILEKIKPFKYKTIFVVVIILLIIFEYMNFPPSHITDLSKTPDVYRWLKEQPGDFII